MTYFENLQQTKSFCWIIILLACLLLTGCAPALHLSAKNGDLSKLNSLLESGIDVNQQDSNGVTALHNSASQGHSEITKTLLAKGAEVDPRTKNSQTPLIYAVQQGHLEVVKLLLAHGADVNAKELSIGSFPLNEAIMLGHIQVAKVLLAHGADVTAKINTECTPLHAAADKGYVDLVEAILEKNSEIDPKDQNSQTPLLYAVKNNHVDVVKVLLAHGADVNLKESSIGSFPLNEAIMLGHIEVAKVLLTHRVDLSVHINTGVTSLHAAAYKGYADLVEAILEKDADINPKDKDAQTPLFIAAWNNHIDVVKVLLLNGADTNIKNNKGVSPLMIAKLNHHDSVVKVLAEGYHTTKLHLAVRQQNLKQIKLLCKEAVDLNSTNTDGMTPLHLAASMDQKEVCWALLDAGAKAEPLAKFPEVTAKTYNVVTDYYFTKNDYGNGIKYFEFANQYSEKASLQNVEILEQFKTENVAIGAILGGLAGGILGALTGDSDAIAAGFAAGSLVGGGAGYHGEKKRVYFATEEARIDAILVNIDRENQRLSQYLSLARQYVFEIKSKIQITNQQYTDGIISLEQTSVEMAKIQDNRDQIANSIAAFRQQKMKYQSLTDGGDDSDTVFDNRLNVLETEIAKLENDLDSLDEALKLSKVG